MNKNQSGSANPNWRGGKTKYSCKFSGKEFYAYASERKRGGAQYCSRKCSLEVRKNRVMLTCAYCGKKFEVRKGDLINKGYKRRCCSIECSARWRSENFSGENNWFYGTKQTLEHIQKRADALKGEKHYNWKGGRKKQAGYIFIKLPNGKYIQEHRQIAGKTLGRKLKRNESVHHINGNTTDNKNENLLICTQSYHAWLHRTMATLYQQEHFPT